MNDVITRSDVARSAQRIGEQNQRPTYRPDIDGLRALAIISVVAYHLSPDLIAGGFLGVDLFFVISGFLISTIIFKSLENNGFSFIEFYAHRIRRIFPALTLVVAFCFCVGRQALLPNEFRLLGKHIVASTSFFENYRLWQEAGYFDIATSLKPLMHLWSLAIEEQFYIIFPLLIWGAWRLRLNLLVVVGLVFAASLATYLHTVGPKPIAAFFGPKARFWELMAGAVLAHVMLHGALLPQRFRRLRPSPGGSLPANTATAALARDEKAGWKSSLLSVVGFLLLGFVILGASRQLPWADATGEMLAVLGAVLLIASRPTAWINRVLLASRPAVFIGLISYPLYLWHWPLLSFLTIVEGNVPPFHQRALAVSASFVLAYLTYRFIERPIRRERNRRVQITGGLIAASACLLLLGFSSRHLVPEYAEATKKIMEAWDFSGYPAPDGLYIDKEYQFPALGHNDKSKVALIGDSHAEQYEQAFATALLTHPANERPEVMFVVYTRDEVLVRVREAAKKMAKDETVKAVVLSEYWAIKRASSKINYAIRCCGDGLMQMLGEGHRRAPLTNTQLDEINKYLEDEITALKQAGKEVYIILDNPFGEELAPRSLLDRSFFRKIEIVTVPLSKKEAIERDEPTRSQMLKIAADTGAKVIDPIEHLCNESVCPALSPEGMPIYKDYDHLSLYTVTHEVHYLDFIAEQRRHE